MRGGVIVIVDIDCECESGMYAGSAQRLGEGDDVIACDVFVECVCVYVMTLLILCCAGMKSHCLDVYVCLL